MSDKIEFGAHLSISSARSKARQLINQFQRDKSIADSSAYYPDILRMHVKKDLMSIIDGDRHLAQRGSTLCGPAAFFFNIARSRPDIYTQIVLGLYKKGKVQLENLTLESSRLARKATLSQIIGIDWMILSSIKPWYDDPDDTLTGLTFPGGLMDWLSDTGYQAFASIDYTGADLKNLLQAQTAYASGHDVFLLVNSKLFTPSGKWINTWYPNHWAVLNSNIKIRKYDRALKRHEVPVALSGRLVKQILQAWRDDEDRDLKQPVKIEYQVMLDVFTWGEPHQPVFNAAGFSQKPELRLFFNHYYGFIKTRR